MLQFAWILIGCMLASVLQARPNLTSSPSAETILVFRCVDGRFVSSSEVSSEAKECLARLGIGVETAVQILRKMRKLRRKREFTIVQVHDCPRFSMCQQGWGRRLSCFRTDGFFQMYSPNEMMTMKIATRVLQAVAKTMI